MVRTLIHVLLWAISLVAAYLYARFQGGFASWFLLSATSVIAVYEFLTRLLAGRGMRSRRFLSATGLTAGQDLDVELDVQFANRWPVVWLAIEDQIPRELQIRGAVNRRIFFPGFQTKLWMRYKISNLQRGKYTFGDTVFRTSDIFGFERRKMVHRRNDSITVYPKMVPIHTWNTVNRLNNGLSFAQNQAVEDTVNVLGIREYAPGDRLSQIHWRTTAKTGRLMTKEFEWHSTNEWVLFFNRNAEDFAAESLITFETAVTVAASLMRYGLHKKHAVGLVSYGKERMAIPPYRSQDQFLKVLDHLAVVQPDSELPFTAVLLRELAYLPKGATAVLITPVIGDELVKVMDLLHYRRIKSELFLLKSHSHLSERERTCLVKLEKYGVLTHLIGSEQDLAGTIGGATVRAANN
ncbi:DUF58 domain-containing protein [Effusibacillus dendaii]|uniref:DUF58 domain-containing protein n=1 Tax=Effusibacillus dendaii TaxID=2743772 RepID=A0A7I8DAZ6_9BACL|nr:DUF58 domain-containing protein [Effusibacillus dendaii]BCJ87167.1 hypothetical protein skT53_21520 [Effusibacillus dendaii]